MRRVVWLAVFAVGCFHEAENPELPYVVNAGGPVLEAPRWAVITFANDPLRDDIDTFADALATSEYWKAAVGGYGVGAATAIDVKLADNSPGFMTDGDVQFFLTKNLTPLASGWPSPKEAIVYVVFQTDSMESGACLAYGAYHSDFLLPDGTRVAYAVIPRCAYLGYVPLDAALAATTHELAEAATDPYPFAAPAYNTVSDFAWNLYSGSEVGDMCENLPWYVEPALGHEVVRIWSNVAASAGHDPCVPNPSDDAYFIASPELPDELVLSIPNAPIPTSVPARGVKIPVGTERTIDVRLLSDKPTGTISVSAVEWPVDATVALSDLDLSWDRATGTNGDTLHLTIGARGDSAGIGHELFLITAQVGDAVHAWPVAVAF